MKYFHVFFAALFFAALVVVSCSKSEDILADEHLKVESVFGEIKAIGLTESDIENIGMVHNFYLKAAYDQLDQNSKYSKENQIEEYFKALDLDISSTGYNSESLYEMSYQSHITLKNSDFFLGHKSLDNTNLNSYLAIIYDELEKSSSSSEFDTRMNDLYDSVSSDTNLNEFEIEAIKVTIVVSKNSANIWMPESLGGQGLTSTGSLGIGAKWNWGNAVLGDISGAMSVMAELGIAGAVLGTVPGTNVAIGLAVGVSAGIGSAIGGLT